MPCARKTSALGMRAPSTTHSPRPMRARARCESGARSPLEPTLPCDGTTGMMFALIMAINASSVELRTPECPFARAFTRNIIIARTISGGSSGPIPAACEMRRFSCSACTSAGGITTLANSPKPVVSPYTTRPSAIQRSTTPRARSTRERASALSSIRTDASYAARTSVSIVNVSPSRTTTIDCIPECC